MRIKRLFTYLFLLAICVSCTKDNALDCFKPTGEITSETRFPGSFKRIEVNDKINVTILKGSEYKVEVIAGKHLLKNILTKVKDNVLTVVNDNRCNFVRGYKKEINMNITVPYVQMVTNAGVAPLTFAEGFSQDTLIVRIINSGDIHINGTFNQLRTSTHGNGDTYVNGTANSFYVFTNGLNYVWADNFKVKDYTFIQTLTFGDCYVNGDGLNTLVYQIESDGNVYYTGTPVTITNTSPPDAKGRLGKKE